MSTATPRSLPVAVIGAGPVGLAAAAHLHGRGLPFVVLEAGPAIGAAISEWGHVRLFSPWRYVIDEEARELLEPTGWTAPHAGAYPTGHDIVEAYLRPLATVPAIAAHLRTGARVTTVSRHGADKLRDAGREDLPFELVLDVDGHEERLLASAVIDATGTWSTPNPLGPGIPAAGERAVAGLVTYRIPDVDGADRERHAGRTTLVVGSGHSAVGTVLSLAELARTTSGTRVVWAVRRSTVAQLFGGGERDALVARGLLGTRVRALVERGEVELVLDVRPERLERVDGRAVLHARTAAGEARALPSADVVVALTGFRPDLSLLAELRLALDPVVEATPALAPLIDPNHHSCGSVTPHGAAELAHPEPGLFVVGMKSYGRAPTFLLLTGYEQVRSVVAHLAGDEEAARDVRLVLPETGVCSSDALDADARGVPPEGATAAPAELQLVGAPSASGCC